MTDQLKAARVTLFILAVLGTVLGLLAGPGSQSGGLLVTLVACLGLARSFPSCAAAGGGGRSALPTGGPLGPPPNQGSAARPPAAARQGRCGRCDAPPERETS